MTEFGKTLREAREAKGLSTAQIADQTHLLPQIVEDLENEDFHRISAPIYGRGFVKLYCEAVGLEPKPLVDEFMAILNGEREPTIRIREVELPPDEAVSNEAESTPEEPPTPAYVQPELEPSAAPPLPAPTADIPPPASEERQYRPDYAQPPSAFGPSVNFGRLAVLAGGAVILLVLLFLGGRALYRATMTVPGEEPTAEVEAETTPAAKAETKPEVVKPDAQPSQEKQNRTPKSVPPLYVD